ncbi:MAG TPA: DUF1080 domain-containing protein [Pirellulales bacterium]|nr:DUF1080 domain-containing protein [Pirellulales bacterium]
MYGRCFAMAFLVAMVAVAQAAEPNDNPTYDDPFAASADGDFAIQGEYVGDLDTGFGSLKTGARVIALGKGKFHTVLYLGGLPGDGWNKEIYEGDGELKDGAAVFQQPQGSGRIENGTLTMTSSDGDAVGKLSRTERKSSTLGQKPPAGAVVLFDGKNTDAWENSRMTADGLLIPAATSKQKFGSCTLHLEFRTPFMPVARGQGRGNSGCYLQGRYEVQILDSFGLAGKDNECGGIYSVKDPAVNMCYPPLTWQTYDIDYTAAEFDSAGQKQKNARMTVRHNGVVVHDNVELPKSTTAAPVGEGPEKGPIYLQDHGNPVRFRNVWLVER